MRNFFLELIEASVWCKPKGDWQYPMTPAKVSPVNGYRGSFKVGNTLISLPTELDTYHLFQIGRYDPELLKLRIGQGEWQTFNGLINRNNVYAMAYTDEGLVFPRCDVYFRFYFNKCIYIALKWDYNIDIDYIQLQNISVRFFDPSYLSDNPEVIAGNFSSFSMPLSSTTDEQSLQTFVSHYPEQNVSIWTNGYLSNLSQAVIGTTVDAIYDPVAKPAISLRLSELPVFLSALDSQRKYLFHIEPEDPGNVDFLSNIDFYLVGVLGTEKFGLYIHRNNISNVRNVSFHDFSIKAVNVQNLIRELPEFMSQYDLYIEGHVRRSPFNEDAIDTKDRLLSLYRLDPQLVESFMTGVNSAGLWNASQLESSITQAFMAANYETLPSFNLEEVGGYFSMTKRICSPIQPVSANSTVVPPCYTPNYTALEYTNNLLTAIYAASNNGEVYAVQSNASYVEFINGLFTENYQDLYTVWTGAPIPIPAYTEFRAYGLNANNVWSDVTSAVTVSNGNITAVPSNATTVIKMNNYILKQNYKFAISKAAFSFEINDPYLNSIPYGDMKVFLNGYSLIQNVDYILAGNQIYITNFDLVNVNTYNLVMVLLIGFCTPTLEPEAIDNFFILPNTSVILEELQEHLENLHQPVIPHVNHQLLTDQTFSSPFLSVNIKTPIINTSKYLTQDSQTLLESSLEVSNAIERLVYFSNDVNVYNGSPYAGFIVNNKTKLVSAFLSQVLTNLLNGNYDAFIATPYVGGDIGNLLLSLSRLFENDPLWNDRVSPLFYKVVAFNTNEAVYLSIENFEFFKRVLRYYSNDRFDYFGSISNIVVNF